MQGPSPLQRMQAANAASVPQRPGSPARPMQRRALGEDMPMQLVSLEVDIGRLHSINSLGHRRTVKSHELLPRYREYLIRQMGGNQMPGLVHIRNMIWAFDVEDWDYAMRLAAYGMRHGVMGMPDGFRRDFPNYVLGTVGDASASRMNGGLPPLPCIATAYQWMVDNPQWDLVDKIRAAVLKSMGGLLERQDAPRALALYEEAQRLDNAVNLKRKIQKLRGA